MKKIFFLSVLLVSLLIIPVSAANVGDKISEAVYTDIVAYVNNYPMPAYVVDGYAVIVAEDLRDYCCDVVYDEVTRSLYITKAGEDATFSNKLVYKPNRETGEYYTDVLYTDIKTYVNGNEVKSFNVNGKTMIVIDEFGKNMDGYEWDNVNRAAFSYLADKPMAEFKPVTKRVEVLLEKEGYYDLKCYTGKYESVNLTKTYTGAYDFDFDGIKEEISIEAIDKDGVLMGIEDVYNIKVSVAGKKFEFETTLPMFEGILVCDMDTDDTVKDLIVVLDHSGLVTYHCFKYGDELEKYRFSQTFYNSIPGEKRDTLYFYSVPVNSDVELINFDDNNLKIWMDTDSCFCWDVLTEFEKSNVDNMLYVQKDIAYYEIPEFYLKKCKPYSYDSIEEKEMWENGYYMKAHCNHNGESINIKKGEYFKAIYDNGKKYVYIEKLSGESGWIYVGNDEGYNLNPIFFNPRTP